jgi:hypothetical protein
VAVIEIKHSIAWPWITNWDQVERAIIAGLEPLWAGQQTARQVTTALKPAVDEILRRAPS